MKLIILPIEEKDLPQYKSDMQEAFQKGYEEDFGKTDEVILPEEDIEQSLQNKGAFVSYVDANITEYKNTLQSLCCRNWRYFYAYLVMILMSVSYIAERFSQLVMILFAPADFKGAVNLLDKQKANHLVGKGHFRKAQG